MIALRAVLVRIQAKVVSDSALQEAIKVAVKHQGNDESLFVIQAASALLGELAVKMNQVSNIVILSTCFLIVFLYRFVDFRQVPKCLKWRNLKTVSFCNFRRSFSSLFYYCNLAICRLC